MINFSKSSHLGSSIGSWDGGSGVFDYYKSFSAVDEELVLCCYKMAATRHCRNIG